jgi:hypothetical protein
MTTFDALNAIRERLLLSLEGKIGLDDEKIGQLWGLALYDGCNRNGKKWKGEGRRFLFTIDFALSDRRAMLDPVAVRVLADIIGEYVGKARIGKAEVKDWHERLDEHFNLSHAISGPTTPMDDVHHMLFVLLRNLETGKVNAAKEDADRIISFCTSPVFLGSTASIFFVVLLLAFNLSEKDDASQKKWHAVLDSCRYMLHSPPLLREGNEPWNRLSGGIPYCEGK